MNKFWSSRLEGIKPYVPGEQPKIVNLIKLNTNENPYPPSPKAIEAVNKLEPGTFRLYPDPECSGLVKAIADCYGVKNEQVFVGNGSDEILAFAYLAFFDKGKEIVFADITYSFYPVYADFFGLDYRQIPLKDDFTFAVDAFCGGNHGVIIANPNAPTGIDMGLENIERILKANPDVVVIVDEAYVDFGCETALPLIDKYPNLLIIRTFSKSRSLAGLRVGYAIGDEKLIEALNCVKNCINSYTLDRVALAAAQAAVEDKAYFEETCGKIIATRDVTVKALREIGFTVLDSGANFIFAKHETVSGTELFKKLREMGIIVRHFSTPRINEWLRITIGTDDEMSALIEGIKKII
ncbi:MAG: histidinol-phosphate transaminase [Ruminococcaceae bacterium]|nr:histidinol-phosphate transaminase [Oscillospiraceae bacterium]